MAIIQASGVSIRYITGDFKDIGIKEYITGVRMERAKEFLLGGHSVCDTAFMVGYRDEFNFSKAFKKYYGKAPSYIKGE